VSVILDVANIGGGLLNKADNRSTKKKPMKTFVPIRLISQKKRNFGFKADFSE